MLHLRIQPASKSLLFLPGSTSFLNGKSTDKAQFFFAHLVHDSCNQGQLSQGGDSRPKHPSPPFNLLSFTVNFRLGQNRKSRNGVNRIETFIRQTAFRKVVTSLAKLNWQQGNIIFTNDDEER